MRSWASSVQTRKAPPANAARAVHPVVTRHRLLTAVTAPKIQLQVLTGLDAVDGIGDTGEHHLFPRLIAPRDIHSRIRVRLVRRRVVVMRDGVDLRAFGKLQ